MEDTTDKDSSWKLWCFWICLGVITLFFGINFSTTSGNVRFNYTLYNKLTNGKPSSIDVYVPDGNDPYPR